MTAELTCQRGHFTLPDGQHYLNCAYMGPIPKVAEEAGIDGLRMKRFPQTIVPDDFFAPVDRLRSRFGSLVNGSADQVAIVPSVSYAVSTITRNTALGPGDNVVITHEQFPGNVYPWRRLVQEHGGELRVVGPAPGSRGAEWSERIVGAIDERTAAVAMGTVHWTDGTRFDLEAVRRRSREVGAALVLDGTQSVGASPIDVAALGPDALVCAGYKWLLGPYSVSLAYFGERYLDGVPLEETWGGRLGSEDFRGLVDYVDEYQPGAVRFDMGERSNFALLPALSASLGLLLEWTPQGVSGYCRALFADALPRLRELGLGIEEDAWRSDHLFGLRVPPSASTEALKGAFESHRVGVSFRGSSVRVSPNVYNTPEDVEALIAALEDVLET